MLFSVTLLVIFLTTKVAHLHYGATANKYGRATTNLYLKEDA